MSKEKSGLTRWIPAKGSLELREGLTIDNLKNEPVKIRVRKSCEELITKTEGLEGTEHGRKENSQG